MKKVILSNDVLLPEIIRLLNEGESITMKVKGNSMLPFITDRNSALLREVDVSKLKKGDIVLATTNKAQYVLHRITAIKNGYIILMGDGNLYGRETCTLEEIVGIAVLVIKGEKKTDCTSLTERWKAWIWYALLPWRRYLLAIYKRIKK